MQLGSAQIRVTGALAVDGPPELEMLGIGGFVSPQLLAGNGCVVLDFPAHEMVLLPDTPLPDVERRLRSNYPRTQTLRVPTHLDSGADGRPLYVDIKLDAKDRVIAELDTGARRTEFRARDLGVTVGAGSTTGLAVSGARTKGDIIDGQRVSIADWTFGPMPVVARPKLDERSSFDVGATLGMDVLQTLVLVIPADLESHGLLLVRWPDRPPSSR
jgi:hypothetical protein